MQPSERSCERCAGPFIIRRASQRHQRFCSVRCQALARPKRDVAERFWSKVEKTDGCWLWRASFQSSGYGSFSYEGRLQGAHRVAWMLAHAGESIPTGAAVLHACDIKQCVNPAHLSIGTPAENSRDMVRKGRHGEGKLSVADVLAIRADSRTHRLTAADYGVTRSMVSAIKRGDAWSAA